MNGTTSGADAAPALSGFSYYTKTLKRYLGNRRWLTMYLLGRFRMWRTLMVFFAPEILPVESPAGFFSGLDRQAAVAALRQDGFYPNLRLPPHILKGLREFAAGHPCYADGDTNAPFFALRHAEAENRFGRRIMLGRYFNTARHCPEIVALQNDPALVAVAAEYFGAQPRHIGNRMWWSFARPASERECRRAGQEFHWDLDDYRTLTFFFYLTDVTPRSGAHIVIKGSHRRKKPSHLFSFSKSRSEEHLAAVYGRENFVNLRGPAGTGFAEDTFCFHKGLHPLEDHRLIVQVRFALNDYDDAHDRRPELPAGRPPAAAAPM